MFTKVDCSYSQFYMGILAGSSLLELGLQIYRSKTHNHDNSTKVGIAVSRALQNISFVMPIIEAGYRAWRSVAHVNELMILKAWIVLPYGLVSYVTLGLGFNPIFALRPPREPKDLTAHFTPLICNLFRLLNTIAVSLLSLTGKVSRPSAFLTISACLINGVAQHCLEGVHCRKVLRSPPQVVPMNISIS